MWLDGVHVSDHHSLANTVPETAFCIYQLAFAIITPALISGAMVRDMKQLQGLLINFWYGTGGPYEVWFSFGVSGALALAGVLSCCSHILASGWFLVQRRNFGLCWGMRGMKCNHEFIAYAS